MELLDWIKNKGGLSSMAKENEAKSNLLYSVIDSSDFYNCPVEKTSRSTMNVPFTLTETEREIDFLQGAEAEGLVNLKGHRSVGGIRISLYNAMTLEGAEKVAEFMENFRTNN